MTLTLAIDPNRKITTTSTKPGTVVAPKTGITVLAKDTTGKVVTADLAELDDASVTAYLESIKNLIKRKEYRKKLIKIRLPQKGA
jgi:hypothetical protein